MPYSLFFPHCGTVTTQWNCPIWIWEAEDRGAHPANSPRTCDTGNERSWVVSNCWQSGNAHYCIKISFSLQLQSWQSWHLWEQSAQVFSRNSFKDDMWERGWSEATAFFSNQESFFPNASLQSNTHSRIQWKPRLLSACYEPTPDAAKPSGENRRMCAALRVTVCPGRGGRGEKTPGKGLHTDDGAKEPDRSSPALVHLVRLLHWDGEGFSQEDGEGKWLHQKSQAMWFLRQ